MTLVQIYDSLVRAFRGPLVVNAILSLIFVPVIKVTGWLPPEVLAIWTWISGGLAGVLFFLIVFDMRNQRALAAYNAMAREEWDGGGFWAGWLKPIVPDRMLSILAKIVWLEFAILCFADQILALHLFTVFAGLVSFVMATVKYDPRVQAKLADGSPEYAAAQVPGLPAALTMGLLWLWTGIAGCLFATGFAVAVFVFDVPFYYYFGPSYGEEVSPTIMALIVGGLGLAFLLLAARGWMHMRKASK